MAKSKREQFEYNRQKITEKAESGDIGETDKEYIIEFLDAKDPEEPRVTDPHDTTKSDGTLYGYAYGLKRVCDLADFQITSGDVEQLNELLSQIKRGNVDGVKDEGLTKGTVANYQKALRKFYGYHSDLGVDKEDVFLYTTEKKAVDERDIFEKEDIQAIRDACEDDRDRALVDMLLYTGQRISAILNLRIKDIDLEEGVFYLNEEAGDLKGADGKKPLLYAESAVRDWLRSHPVKDDPEARLICQKMPNAGKYDYEQGSTLDKSSVYRALNKIGERAGVDKPMNPHNFRHTFVTIAARDYDMDFDTIKRIIGHEPDSNVMESTYAHLTDDDVIDQAKDDMGIEEKEEESPLTPDVCDNCGEPIPIDDAKACPSCGIAFTPDARQTKDKMQGKVREQKEQAETLEEYRDADAIAQALDDDPKLAAELMDKLGSVADE
jgi:integrase